MTEIDDSLYSRQRYVLGDSAMLRMARCNVFISGMTGLGVETAKNVILAGVRSVTVHDTQTACVSDLATNFFLRHEDTLNGGSNRASACLPRLAELNPYVSVVSSSSPLTGDSLSQLDDFQCVVLVDATHSLSLLVDEYCRNHSPPIKFICGSVRGVFGSVFCDFGDSFEVADYNDEEPVEGFVGGITKANPGVVSCLENQIHGLESGMHVRFSEVNGMTALNGNCYEVKVLSPREFRIGDTSGEEFASHAHGGIFRQVKMPQTVNFESLEKQLCKPDCIIPDFCKPEASTQIHVAMLALEQFRADNGALPKAWCQDDSDKLVECAARVSSSNSDLAACLNEDVVRDLSYTSSGCFAPLCASLGGFLAQEVLKSVSGKFMPLKQLLYIDTREVLPQPRPTKDLASEYCQPRADRYDPLRVCVGNKVVDKLSNLRLFMVGCGAIGCEMLKNYAMLGVGHASQGLITITDNDLIEKSNLNRQFLFRPRHIQKPKSTTAAASVTEINPDLRIDAHQEKVGPQTEKTHYPDDFFQRQDVCVNALDNVEARRYMDSRCVGNAKALLESGTLGAKGHIQVIVPHMTESYSSQADPPSKDVPYCTLKSFPASIEHTIQWARDKFETAFTQKPGMFSRFWQVNKSPDDVLKVLLNNSIPENALPATRLLCNRPSTWSQCAAQARIKFEKLFNHQPRDLLSAFPLDTTMTDGTLFWQSPKRPPTPLNFDVENELHMQFVTSYACLRANVCAVSYSTEDLESASLHSLLKEVSVPEFRPSGKKIETDEKAAAPAETDVTEDAIEKSTSNLASFLRKVDIKPDMLRMCPEAFEKDDDSNHHIDFITATSNLRAEVYSIAPVDRLKTKLIAGRIVPAIATTTAAVAGLVTIELVKVAMGLEMSSYRNGFLNLAIPAIILSEPAAALRNQVMPGVYTTLWDKWEIQGSSTMTLQELMSQVKAKFGLEPTMLVHGVKMVYVPVMPGHKKRLTQPVEKYVKRSGDDEYTDLTVAFCGPDQEDVTGPPVRYVFHA
eukprot:scpid34613/ scgid34922/ Ubiquitin-like modifier-activating enzyme 6; Monocyte protein 4; Ubiquitin-activating enzyme E1-like protein 2